MSAPANTPATLAITGATGFVGQAVLDRLTRDGRTARLLARTPPDDRPGFAWVKGSLAEPFALEDWLHGADTVIHIAGLTTSTRPRHFEIANVIGTRHVVEAAKTAGARRFVFVSSLAAREQDLSAYGASKARAEAVVAASGLDWTIVRPPGVYGPRDHDYRAMFDAARWRVMPLPPPGRSSLIHVDDLARLLLVLAAIPAGAGSVVSGAVLEPDDGHAGGWSHAELARAIGAAVGVTVWPLNLPARLLTLAARLDERVRGRRARLTQDRARYFAHPDWVARPDHAVPPAIWRPAIATREGLCDTARWYRDNGLL